MPASFLRCRYRPGRIIQNKKGTCQGIYSSKNFEAANNHKTYGNISGVDLSCGKPIPAIARVSIRENARPADAGALLAGGGHAFFRTLGKRAALELR